MKSNIYHTELSIAELGVSCATDAATGGQINVTGGWK